MDPTPGPPTVFADGIVHRYRGQVALRDLAVVLTPGCTGLVGVNGAGKSTLLRLLAVAFAPSSGSLRVFGEDVRRFPRRARRRIGYMPQTLEIPDRLKVVDFLAYMSWLRGFSRRERPGLVDEALVLGDLVSQGRDAVGSLSGGMRRRLLFAQAVLGSPDLVLLDEPTTGLDPEQRVRIRALVAALPRTASVVMSSHVMEDLAAVADRMLMLEEGRLVYDGTVADLSVTGERLVGSGAGLDPLEAAFLHLRRRSEIR